MLAWSYLSKGKSPSDNLICGADANTVHGSKNSDIDKFSYLWNRIYTWAHIVLRESLKRSYQVLHRYVCDEGWIFHSLTIDFVIQKYISALKQLTSPGI